MDENIATPHGFNPRNPAKSKHIPKFPDLWALYPSAFPSGRLDFAVRQWPYVTFVTRRILPNYSYGLAEDLERMFRTPLPLKYTFSVNTL
jgi:hypothetical protein